MASSVDEVSDIPRVLLVSGLVTVGIQTLGFFHGYIRQTEHFYDALGGLNSLGLIAVTAGLNWNLFGSDARKICITILFGLSRLWLLLFLAWRARERKGDGRFEQLKPYFFKFFIVWMLQAIWVLGVAMPLLVVNGVTKVSLLDSISYHSIFLYLNFLAMFSMIDVSITFLFGVINSIL